MDTFLYGSSGPRLLPASDKPAPQGQFCSPMSNKKLRKGREKTKHPKSVSSALFPLAASMSCCTHSKPPCLLYPLFQPSQHVGCSLGRASSVCWGPASTLHSTSNFLSNL